MQMMSATRFDTLFYHFTCVCERLRRSMIQGSSIVHQLLQLSSSSSGTSDPRFLGLFSNRPCSRAYGSVRKWCLRCLRLRLPEPCVVLRCERYSRWRGVDIIEEGVLWSAMGVDLVVYEVFPIKTRISRSSPVAKFGPGPSYGSSIARFVAGAPGTLARAMAPREGRTKPNPAALSAVDRRWRSLKWRTNEETRLDALRDVPKEKAKGGMTTG